MGLYERAVSALLSEGDVGQADAVIVACGGDTDARALTEAGFGNVLITNLDASRRIGTGGCKWRRCDAEDLPFPNDSFDFGFVHAGLHHCRSPHRALLELLRVCRKGVLVVEARDSATMRLALRLGLAGDYEVESVAMGQCGLRDTPIPNYVYRWTEREVEKTVSSAYPDRIMRLRFFYGLRLPTERMTAAGRGKRTVARALGFLASALFRIAPSQGNEFAFAVLKTEETRQWESGFDAAHYTKAA